MGQGMVKKDKGRRAVHGSALLVLLLLSSSTQPLPHTTFDRFFSFFLFLFVTRTSFSTLQTTKKEVHFFTVQPTHQK